MLTTFNNDEPNQAITKPKAIPPLPSLRISIQQKREWDQTDVKLADGSNKRCQPSTLVRTRRAHEDFSAGAPFPSEWLQFLDKSQQPAQASLTGRSFIFYDE